MRVWKSDSLENDACQNCVVVLSHRTCKTLISNQLGKEGKLKHMKMIAIITLAAAAIGLSACAHKETASTSSSTMSHSSYSK